MMVVMRRSALVVLAVVLALGAGQCLFDQDDRYGTRDCMMLDLCLLMVVVLSIAPILLAGPLLSGWAEAYIPLTLVTAPVRVLDPPPKTAALS